jgi:serine/threonine protein kinase
MLRTGVQKTILRNITKADMVGMTISHYRILEQLGAGGMGVVYNAEDPTRSRCRAQVFA